MYIDKKRDMDRYMIDRKEYRQKDDIKCLPQLHSTFVTEANLQLNP